MIMIYNLSVLDIRQPPQIFEYTYIAITEISTSKQQPEISIWFLYGILEIDVVDETDQPEDYDKGEEKHRIDHPHEGVAEIYFPVTLILAPCLGLGDWSLSESVYVGLH